MKKNSTGLSLLMILILVVASSLLITYGANLSQKIQSETQVELNDRSLRLYFNNRFKQNDVLDTISISENMLIINLENSYILIYEEDHQLKEQMSTDPTRFENGGETIAYASDFSVDIENNLISINYRNEANELINLLYRLSAGEVYE